MPDENSVKREKMTIGDLASMMGVNQLTVKNFLDDHPEVERTRDMAGTLYIYADTLPWRKRK